MDEEVTLTEEQVLSGPPTEAPSQEPEDKTDNPDPIVDQPPTPSVAPVDPDGPKYRGKLIAMMDAGECWQAIKTIRPEHPLARIEPTSDGDARYQRALTDILKTTEQK